MSRGAGRLNPLAASGPRNRRSSSASIAVVPRRSTQVTATLENNVSRSGAYRKSIELMLQIHRQFGLIQK